MNDILDNLNSEQRAAAEAIDGRIRVVAGAGTGKTRALTHRYAYLVKEIGIPPKDILCLTFSNKAAREIKDRIIKLVGLEHTSEFICTIHSVCRRILLRDIHLLGFPHKFGILDNEDRRSLALMAIKEAHERNIDLIYQQNDSGINGLLKAIEIYKNKENYIETCIYNKNFLPENAVEIYIKLQIRYFYLDFNDLINFALYILTQKNKKYKEAQEYWLKKFQYIMLDEAQDCSNSDWIFINCLAEQYKNLYIVGDIDQTIYEWRGAKPDYFKNFICSNSFNLKQNYRSTPDIIALSNKLIKHNENRFKDQELFTENKQFLINIHYASKDEKDEGIFIADEIAQIVNNYDVGYDDIAILYRSGWLTRPIEQVFMERLIPYNILSGDRFFDRKVVKCALSYLKIVNDDDDLALSYVINKPQRGIDKTLKKKFREIAEREGIKLFPAIKLYCKENEVTIDAELYNFVSVIENARGMIINNKSISEVLSYVLTEGGYINYIRALDETKDPDEQEMDDLVEFINSVKSYEESNENLVDLNTYLQEISLYTNTDNNLKKSAVKMMTIHQSKGLEFPFVFIIGVSDGCFPSSRTIGDRKKEGLEEERRLMYVALTRAKKRVYLTEPRKRKGINVRFSQFLKELDDNYSIGHKGDFDENLYERNEQIINNSEPIQVLFNNGDRVKHKKMIAWGTGVIVDLRNDICVVDFENKEELVNLSQQVLTKIEEIQ